MGKDDRLSASPDSELVEEIRDIEWARHPRLMKEIKDQRKLTQQDSQKAHSAKIDSPESQRNRLDVEALVTLGQMRANRFLIRLIARPSHSGRAHVQSPGKIGINPQTGCTLRSSPPAN